MAILKSSILFLSLIMVTMQEQLAVLENCPDTSHRKFRALINKCSIERYHCLRNGSDCSGNSKTPDTVIEKCCFPKVRRKGLKTVYCKNLDAEKCTEERFSPWFTWSNESDKCPFLKSNCREEGQVLESNELSDTDNWCRCDYTRGYYYITSPKDRCKCQPREEDCACYIKPWGGNDKSLSQDYSCSQGNTTQDTVVFPKTNTQRNQRIEKPKIMKALPENTEKGKDKGIRSSITWSYPSGHYTLDLLKVCILALTLVTIATIIIMIVLIVLFPKKVVNIELFLQAKKMALQRSRSYKNTEPGTVHGNTEYDFLKETKHSLEAPTMIFHQLNDMIGVPRLHHVHQFAEIEKIFNDEQTRTIILSGQTGAGKTESAYWICKEAQSKYSVIAKISAFDKAKFVTSLKNFAINLNLDLQHEEGDMKIIESISSTIVTFLNDVSNESGLKNMCLVLIDDVHVDNAVNDSSETTLTAMVLKTINILSRVETLRFIITTTNPMLIDDFSEDCKEVKFEGMTSKECISFLKKSDHFKGETDEAIEILKNKIGCLPITINSARKFMIKQNMHIKKYIKLYEKWKREGNKNTTEVVNCQKIPLEYIKNDVDGSLWEVITLFPYLEYNSIYREVIEACCHHVCKDEKKAEKIIGRFRDYSLCQYLERPRVRVFSTEQSQEDIIISFHSETMLALNFIEQNQTTDRPQLFVLLKMFCFEIDLDSRIDTTLERNLMFLNQARYVLRLYEKGGYNLNESEKVYMSYLNYLIGKTILYQGTDIPLAHKHLMKSRKLCLEFVEEKSDLTVRKCPYLATKEGTDTEEVPKMKSETVLNGYKNISSKTLDRDFVMEFILSKRRNKRDVHILRLESEKPKMCMSNYLSKEDYIYLTTCKPKLAMPLELICKGFLSELLLHILHDNGRALDELMFRAEHNEHVKIACAFEIGTYKTLNILRKREKAFKDFPLLRYLAIERGEQDINVHPCTFDMKSNIENLKKMIENKADHYFQFGVVKAISNKLEHHHCSCHRLLIKCITEKYERAAESERKEILIDGRSHVKLLQKILSKIDKDKNAVKWVEMPKFYNECAKFLQLLGTMGDHKELTDAIEMYEKAITIEENRQPHITRFLLEAYYGKANCLLILNMEEAANDIYINLKKTLPSSNVFIEKMHALFQKKDTST